MVSGFKKCSSPSNGQFLNELAGTAKNIFLLYNGHLLAVCPEKNKKTPVSEKAGGVEKRLILSFKRIASTAGVRTHSDFGIVPSPYTVDFDNEIDGEIMMKVHFILFR